jgi:methionyl-tRNA formyltransferase
MRVIFMGTPGFAVPVLDALASECDITAVFTRPDAASGRGKALLPSPVRSRAEALRLPVCTPRDFYLRDNEGRAVRNAREQLVVDARPLALIEASRPDVIVVAAYGVILPAAVLASAPAGAVNVHASLLPRWRGAAPLQRAILAGDTHVGVSIMRVTEGLDAGPYCATASMAVADKDVTALSRELSQLGATLLLQQLPLIVAGSACWKEQDPALITYADRLRKEEVRLAPELPAEENLRRVRAASEQAPARCRIAGRDVTILAAVSESQVIGMASQVIAVPAGEAAAAGAGALQAVAAPKPQTEGAPEPAVALQAGTASQAGAAHQSVASLQANAAIAAEPGAVFLHNHRLLLACADGRIEIRRLKPSGKAAMDARAFVNGIVSQGEKTRTWGRAGRH